MARQEWTMAQIREIRERLRAGEALSAVVASTGRSRRSMEAAFLRVGDRLGDHLREGRKARHAAAVAMSETRPAVEVAEVFGVAEHTIYDWRWRAGANSRRCAGAAGRRKVKAGDRTRALCWRLDGETYATIGGKLGISEAGARYLVLAEAKRAGVPAERLVRS